MIRDIKKAAYISSDLTDFFGHRSRAKNEDELLTIEHDTLSLKTK